MIKLYLYYSNSTQRGPGMVVKNLLSGLLQLEDIVLVDKPNQAELFGCLQSPVDYLINWLPEKTLMGPNLFVIPEENRFICNKFKSFIVPSQWVKDLYVRSPLMNGKAIDVWSVGIDTKKWRRESNDGFAIKQDCFIYFKNREQSELMEVKKTLDKLKFSYRTIEYGSYDEQELYDLCQTSRFAILLTGTESQGIAYMNILSTNMPCIVLNKSHWQYNANQFINHPATSVPYFNEKCGLILNSIQQLESSLGGFNPCDYAPRDYILANHTQKISAEKYVNLLRQGNQR